jgi:cytochrome P450
VQSVLFQRHRVRFLPAMARRYGDVFRLRFPPYGDTLVVFNRPEHIKQIFAADPRDLHAGDGNKILGPAGTVVNASIIPAHQRRDSFPTQSPGRTDSWAARSNPTRGYRLGGGVRCRIGAGFSVMEGTAVLHEIPHPPYSFCRQRSRTRPSTQHHQRADAGGFASPSHRDTQSPNASRQIRCLFDETT